MEIRIDFVQWLELDVVLMILGYLDNPSDIIRICAVSRFWRHFVVSNKLSKKLCLRLSPQIASVADSSCTVRNNADEWKTIEMEYRSYAFLARALTSSTTNDCIGEAISASSTDHFPRESIENTLYSQDQSRFKSYYWSSKGSENPEEPETLIYKLLANLSVVKEIIIKPFQAYFQYNSPIYSARAVRFRMGHPKSPSDIDCYGDIQLPADDKFVWTYTSPVFPMIQENCLQEFKLPEPVLCVGGFVLIELLGRVQKQDVDDLYYICVSHVKVLGEPLSPKFDIKILEPSGKFSLKYYPELKNQPAPVSRHRFPVEYDHLGSDDDEDDNAPGSDEDEDYNDNEINFFI